MTAIDESTLRMKERKRGWRKQVAWWNDELANMRREVVAAKKQLARKESEELLLERFFPSDEEDACAGFHQHIRELVKSY